jgi:large subunit ribosomal protein L16
MALKNNPNNVNYGRVFKVKLNEKTVISPNYIMPYYMYGIKAMDNGKLTMKHLNAISRLLKRLFKKNVKIKFNISLIIPVTKKPLEARLGGGKAARSHWECPVKKGMVILEISTYLEYHFLKKGLLVVLHKLPFLAKVVKNFY